MFVPVWVIVIIGAIAWLAAGIGVAKLWQKIVGDHDISFEAPFLVIFWPLLVIGIPFFMLLKLTDRIFAK